jgi:hypothetical protein
MSDQTMFPERELIDMSFMDHIRYNNTVPENKTEVDKALQEYNCLSAKFKECTIVFSKRQKDLEAKYDSLAKIISDAMNGILAGVEDNIKRNWSDFGISYGADDKCEINLEHGKIILEQRIKTNFKIKPIKEN